MSVLYLSVPKDRACATRMSENLSTVSPGRPSASPKDEAAAAEVVHDGAAVFERVLDAALEEPGPKLSLRVVREDANAYLAGFAVETRASQAPFLRKDVHYAALFGLSCDVREFLPVYPGVALVPRPPLFWLL